jgi:copper resistance protein C
MKLPAILFISALSLICRGTAMAHAFPERSSPGAGATLQQAPARVVIYFDSELEPIFSKLIVKNEQGAQVSRDSGSIDPGDRKVLATSLPAALPRGSYHVYWSVVSRDGHHTEGDYTFNVR